MGYTTDFEGVIKLNKKLKKKDKEYLVKFSDTRRMRRDIDSKYGVEGEFYVDGGGMCGQDSEDNIINYNQPPPTQPGLWCQWVPTDDGKGIEWDNSEKFYHSDDWMIYLIENFLKPWGYIANGEIIAQGEDPGDKWVLTVTNNVVKRENMGYI